MSRTKMPIQQRNVNNVKNALSVLIKNISIIAVFVAIGVIALLYLGPEINFATKIVFRLAVPSIVLSVSITVVNELWIKNGRQNAREEEDYQVLLSTYDGKSDGLYYPTLQDFLDYEHDRRYKVEYDRLTRMLEREQSILEKRAIKNRLKRWFCKHRIREIIKARNTIRVFMPYEKSEEFDYLRYNIQDVIYKEYSPNDTAKHLTKARFKKYLSTFTFTIIGLNILSIGGSMGNLWVAIIMTTLATLSLILTVVGGFSVGYTNIKVISTGVYKTANSFLDQAVAYCKREGKDLYYEGPTEFRKYIPVKDIEPVKQIESPKEPDIFTKATIEVTKTDKK